MIQLAFVRFTFGSLVLHDKLSPNVVVMLALGVSILFRYWSCRTWVWRPAVGAFNRCLARRGPGAS